MKKKKKERKIEEEVSAAHWSYFYLVRYKKHCSITLEGDSQGNLLLWWWWFGLVCFLRSFHDSLTKTGVKMF